LRNAQAKYLTILHILNPNKIANMSSSTTEKTILFTSQMHWVTLSFTLLTMLLFQSNLSAQNQDIEELRAELEAETVDSLWVKKCIQYTRQMHKRNHQEEVEHQFAQSAVDRALQTNDTLLYALALDNMGLLYRYHQWYAQAIPLHTKAFDLVSNKSVPNIYKMIFANNTGVAARYDQQYDHSVSYYLKALKIATDTDDLRNIAISSNGLGNSLSNIAGREEEAMNYFKKALGVEKVRSDSLGMAMNLLSISDYYVEKKQHTTALKYLDSLWEINHDRNDLFGMAITNEFYGHTYLDQGVHLNKANAYYQKSLKQFQELNNSGREARVLQSLGDLQSKFGHFSNALNYYDRSMRLADSLNHKSVIMQNAFSISSIKEKQGLPNEALKHYKKASQYEDSINIDRQMTRIAALTSEFQLDKKEAQIALLEKEKALIEERSIFQEARIKTHQIYLVILLLGAILIILLINKHYQNKKSHKQAELELQEKEKRLLQTEYEKNIAQAEMLASRMQVNPHFIFNSLNAINLLIQKAEIKKASQYLVTFSRFVRMVLEIPKCQVISLEEELKLIKYYLSLEEKRFNAGFDFRIDISEADDISDIRIPPLLLQPFVENAVWHGLLPSRNENKRLTIKITKTSSYVKIVIDDNGVGRMKSKLKSADNSRESMGMNITQKRIEQFNKSYDCQINLEIIDKHHVNEVGTTIVLTIQNIEILTSIPV